MKAVKITFRGVIGGENLKILKFFIFWFFDFLDRFYTFTLGLDLFTARGSGHRSRSTHFIFRFKVATILSDFPLASRSGVVGQRGFRGNHTRLRTENSAAAKKFSKISVRVASKKARSLARRARLMLARDIADLFASRRGPRPSG